MDEQNWDRSARHSSSTQRWSVVDVGQILGIIEQFEPSAGDLRIEIQDRRLDRRLHRFVNPLDRVLVGKPDRYSGWISTVCNRDVFELEGYGVGTIGDAEVIAVLSVASGGREIAV